MGQLWWPTPRSRTLVRRVFGLHPNQIESKNAALTCPAILYDSFLSRLTIFYTIFDKNHLNTIVGCFNKGQFYFSYLFFWFGIMVGNLYISLLQIRFLVATLLLAARIRTWMLNWFKIIFKEKHPNASKMK